MSNYWDIRCLDCGVDFGIDNANHKDDLMRDLIKAAPALADIADLMENHGLNMGSGYMYVRPRMFATHRGHRLVAIDECGRIDGTCGVRFECTCGASITCKLPPGHPGDHAAERGRREA